MSGYTQAAAGGLGALGEGFKGMGVIRGAHSAEQTIDKDRKLVGDIGDDAKDAQYQIYGNEMEVGGNALNDLESFRFTTPESYETAEFNSDFDVTEVPGYQWRFDQGMDAVKQGQVGSGKIGSGAAMKELTEYGQGMAAGEYADEHARRMDVHKFDTSAARDQFNNDTAALANMENARFNQLGTLTNVGTNATQNYGNEVSKFDQADINAIMQTNPDLAAYMAQKDGAGGIAAGNAAGQMSDMFGGMDSGGGGGGGFDFSSLMNSQ